jgi:hypothetical protein
MGSDRSFVRMVCERSALRRAYARGIKPLRSEGSALILDPAALAGRGAVGKVTEHGGRVLNNPTRRRWLQAVIRARLPPRDEVGYWSFLPT